MEIRQETSTNTSLSPFDVGNAYVLGFLLIIIATAFTYPNTGERSFLDNTEYLLLFTAAIYTFKQHTKLTDAFLLLRVKTKDLIFPLCITPVIKLSNELFVIFLSVITRGRAIEIARYLPHPDIPSSLPVALIALAILTPIQEEMLFRGFMSQGYKQWGARVVNIHSRLAFRFRPQSFSHACFVPPSTGWRIFSNPAYVNFTSCGAPYGHKRVKCLFIFLLAWRNRHFVP